MGDQFREQLNGVLTKKHDSVVKRNENLASMVSMSPTKVVKTAFHGNGKEPAPYMVMLQAEEECFLLIVSSDAWLSTEAHRTGVLEAEEAKRLPIARLYAGVRPALWDRLEREVMQGQVMLPSGAFRGN